MTTLRLTDDEVIAVGATSPHGWRGFLPSVALDAEQLVLAAERGARSLWARDLYADGDESEDRLLQLALESAGSRPEVTAFGALSSARLEPVGPVLNAFATTTDALLLDVVHLDGRHELNESTRDRLEELLAVESTKARDGEIPDAACFVVIRRHDDDETVTVTP